LITTICPERKKTNKNWYNNNTLYGVRMEEGKVHCKNKTKEVSQVTKLGDWGR
jgi:hypothetical protein